MRMTVALIGIALASPAWAQTRQTCVDVQVGSAQSYDCLNQELAASAAAVPKTSAASAAPYSAASPSNVTGQFNESATAERLGPNFGHSVIPYRPATVATPPFGH